MPSFDRIAKLLSLTQALDTGNFRNAQTQAMRAGSMANLAMLPGEMQAQQQQNQYYPQVQQAEIQSRNMQSEGQSLENAGMIDSGVKRGMRPQFDARGISMAGIPPEVSSDQLFDAFKLITGGQELPPELLQQLQYSPDAGKMLLAIQQALNS